jgi:hypothetical protein
VNVHARSRLTPEPLRTLRSETKGQAGACPNRTRAIPCTVRAGTEVHDPEYARNDLGCPQDERSRPGRQSPQIRQIGQPDSGAVSVSTACKPICKPDASEWDETEETEQNERAVLVPVRRGHRIRERSSQTRETYVALLITQRSRVQIPPPLPRPEALSRTEKGPFACDPPPGLRPAACSRRACMPPIDDHLTAVVHDAGGGRTPAEALHLR